MTELLTPLGMLLPALVVLLVKEWTNRRNLRDERSHQLAMRHEDQLESERQQWLGERSRSLSRFIDAFAHFKSVAVGGSHATEEDIISRYAEIEASRYALGVYFPMHVQETARTLTGFCSTLARQRDDASDIHAMIDLAAQKFLDDACAFMDGQGQIKQEGQE